MADESNLKQAAQLREEIYKQALAKARNAYPEINEVVDNHPVEEFLTEYWDYPGKWYVMTAIPEGYKSREALVDEIAEKTIENYLQTKSNKPDEPFWAFIENYPDIVVDYAIVFTDEPYRDYESHFEALCKGATLKFGDEWKLNFNVGKITARVISAGELFAPVDENGEMNYRKAFLFPPYEISYTDEDFEKVNAVLFPNGRDALEVFRWSTDWSDYFDEGNEWWGTLCLSVYDASLKRFVIIMASATD